MTAGRVAALSAEPFLRELEAWTLAAAEGLARLGPGKLLVSGPRWVHDWRSCPHANMILPDWRSSATGGPRDLQSLVSSMPSHPDSWESQGSASCQV